MRGPADLKEAPRTEEDRLRFLVRASRDFALLRRDALSRRARDLFLAASPVEEFSLWILDPAIEVLYPWVRANEPVAGRRPRLAVGRGLVGQACAEERPRYHTVLSRDQYAPEEWGGRPLEELGGVLTCPLRRDGEPLGVVVLRRGEFEEPGPEETSFLGDLSEQLAIAVGNARVHAQAMREKVENQLLLDLSTKLSGSLDIASLLEQIIDLVFQVVRYNAAGIYLVDARTQWITRQTIRGYDPSRDEAVRLKIGRGLIGWCVKTGQGVIVPDVAVDPRYVNARDETRSEMVAPIRVGGEVIGAFNVESDEPDAYEEVDLELLTAFAAQAALAIERARLHEEVLEARRLEGEVTIGRRIQRSFLPDRNPEIPHFDVAGAYHSSDRVGGDYFDFIPIAGAQWGIVVGDVSGKGVAAALIMAAFRASLIAEIRNNYSIRTILGKVNRLLWESVEPDRFVTTLYGVLDPDQRRFTYANAGHNPGLLYRAARRSFDTLDATGPLLGTFESATYKERHVTVGPGDVLVLYTDGVTESMGPGGELFGEERLRQTVEWAREERAAEIVERIIAAVQAFRSSDLDDDVTVVVVKGLD